MYLLQYMQSANIISQLAYVEKILKKFILLPCDEMLQLRLKGSDVS